MLDHGGPSRLYVMEMEEPPTEILTRPSGSFYDQDYYENGPATGKSNYRDYRWLPDLTLPMADWLKRLLHIKDGDTFLDVGCAKGFLVKALRMRGVNAHGYDVSTYAVSHCDEAVRGYVSSDPKVLGERWDHVLLKDVAEHVPLAELTALLEKLVVATRKNLLLIVPLTWHPNGPYLRDEDNADPSHVNAQPLEWWMDLLRSVTPLKEGPITGSWHYPGIKPASEIVHKSCGFIQFTRV